MDAREPYKGKQNMWLMNTGDKTIEVCIMEYKKWFYFKPSIPVQIPDTSIALKYMKSYNPIVICDHPEKYFIDHPMKQMIVRDAGIGDMLLLEPVLRKFKDSGNIEISVLSRYPEVYDNNPHIDITHHTVSKESKAGLKETDYDAWVDLRSYSETAPTRAKKHRTDIYNEKFNLVLTDEEKQPRLYFSEDEKAPFQKKKGKRYIGVSVDASHRYRKYPHEKKLIDYIIKQDKKNIVVLLGTHEGEPVTGPQILDLRNKTSIREMICCVRELDYVIGVDSGIMHTALTLHIPTVCLFTIITPDFRTRYYTGPYKVVTTGDDCIGCGDFHMSKCRHSGKDEGKCQNIDPSDIYNEMILLKGGKKIVHSTKPMLKKPRFVNIDKKLTMPIIVQNEEKNLPRFIENVIKHPCIGRVIAIDGGSTDRTVEMLLDAGAEVYEHPYLSSYHEQQAMQRNISCSYVKDGENILIMDIDECFSKELSEYLPVLAEASFPYGVISRRTFNYYKDINDVSKRIKDYPDFQPRFYKWDRKYKFVGGAHHITLNTLEPIRIQKDILHFEKEGKDRNALEKQWATMMKGVKEFSK